MVLSALLVAARSPSVPTWVLLLLGTAVGVIAGAFLIAYFVLLFVDRDALRSERFTLSKMAIEKSITGDSLMGFAALELGKQEVLSVPEEVAEQRELE
jgi:hypothetical protein